MSEEKEINKALAECSLTVHPVAKGFLVVGCDKDAGALGTDRRQIQSLEAATSVIIIFLSFNSFHFHFFNFYPQIPISIHK